MSPLSLRPATSSDIPAITAIYAPYVQGTTVSFETQPPDEAEMAARLAQRQDLFPWLVCERAGGVVGYAGAGRLAARPGYDWAVEASVYVAQGSRGGGVGRALYAALLPLLAAQGYCEVYALIAAPNPESERFHERMGFRREGLLTRAGRKLGRVVGVAYYAKTLRADDGAPPPPLRLSQLPPGTLDTLLVAAGGQAAQP